MICKGANELVLNQETQNKLNQASQDWADGKGTELGFLKYFVSLLIEVVA